MTNGNGSHPTTPICDTNDPRFVSTVGKLFEIWALCPRDACRRARECRGDNNECVRTYLPLVPEAARMWLPAMFWWREQGATFDEALAKIENSEPGKAFAAWHETVKAMRRKGR